MNFEKLATSPVALEPKRSLVGKAIRWYATEFKKNPREVVCTTLLASISAIVVVVTVCLIMTH